MKILFVLAILMMLSHYYYSLSILRFDRFNSYWINWLRQTDKLMKAGSILVRNPENKKKHESHFNGSKIIAKQASA